MYRCTTVMYLDHFFYPVYSQYYFFLSSVDLNDHKPFKKEDEKNH